MPLSLRTKVFLPLLILMALLIGYLYWGWMPQSLSNIERQYKGATERHLDSVVEGLIPLLLGRELDTIYENFDALLKKNSDWISIRLADSAGRTLYPLENTPSPESAANAQNVHILIKQIIYLNMNLGTLTVEIDHTPHLTAWKKEFHHAVAVMLAVIAVTVLSIGIVLERKVVQPVKALKQQAHALAQGKFGTLNLEAGEDEIGRLVDSFNTMKEKLAMSYNLLTQSEEKNRAITTTANDAIIMMDENGHVSFWNPAAENIFGYTAEEVLGKYLHSIIVPDRYKADYEKGLRYFSETGKGPVVGKTIDMAARRKDGAEFPVELSLSALQMKDKWHAVGVVRDITQRKLAEARILASLEEKELLLQEIHHRVKNNMQVISSMLRLQAGAVKDKNYITILNDSQNRIKAMSLIHEKLYQSKDLAHINFNDYSVDLTEELIRSYGADSGRVTIKIDSENIMLGIDTAIPCGLIINELVSNSLKYAFPKGRRGEVLIFLTKINEDEFELIVSDNGIGIPDDIDFRNTESLGLRLVTILAENQLRGTIELNRTAGTEFRIRFKEIKSEKKA
ncbi:MAG: PAS domain S-box protein [Nitrospirota bacterium]